jgi:radical SAM superfamily enzyme YgiQ (UPF0313 family)
MKTAEHTRQPPTSFRLHATGQNIVVSRKTDSLSISVDGVPVYYFDLAGRLLGCYLSNGHHYRRGLDNRLLDKWHEAGLPHGVRRVRRDVGLEGKREIVGDAYSQVRLTLEAIVDEEVDWARQKPSNDHLEGMVSALESAAHKGYDSLEEDGVEFRSIYSPVGILPPDQYMAVVVQATEGCSHNTCTFCDFYHHDGQNTEFSIKTPDEFQEHIRAIKEFLGDSVLTRRSAFIADGNALVIPQSKLLKLMDVLELEFERIPSGLPPGAQRRYRAENPGHVEGYFSFLDGFSALKKSVSDFEELRGRCLKRVYVGLESGDDELLEWLGKPATVQQTVDAVATMKSAGLAVGVIVMIGPGGHFFSEQHTRGTIDAVREMALDSGDLLYLSEFVNHPGLKYEQLALEKGVRDLKNDEMLEQQETIRAALALRGSDGPKIARYDIKEFVY